MAKGWIVLHNAAGADLIIRVAGIKAVTPAGGGNGTYLWASFHEDDTLWVSESASAVMAAIEKAEADQVDF